MIETGDGSGWFVSLFFGLCTVASALNLVRPARLELAERGFTTYQAGRGSGSFFDWRLCGHFTTWSPAAGTTLVAFEYDSPSSRRHPRLARLNRSLAGGNHALPDTYGLSASELRDLLEARQREATTVAT